MKAGYLLVSGFLAVAGAAPTNNPASSVVHEKRGAHSDIHWTKREAVDPKKRVPVRIALKQRNLEKGEQYLLEV